MCSRFSCTKSKSKGSCTKRVDSSNHLIRSWKVKIPTKPFELPKECALSFQQSSMYRTGAQSITDTFPCSSDNRDSRISDFSLKPDKMVTQGNRNSNRHQHRVTTSPSVKFLGRPTQHCGNQVEGIAPDLFNGMNIEDVLQKLNEGPELCLRGNNADISVGGIPVGPSCVLRIDPDGKPAQSNLPHERRHRRKTSFGREHSNLVTFRTADELDQELIELRNKSKVALDNAWFKIKKEKEVISGHISRVALLEKSLRELLKHGEKNDDVEYHSSKRGLNVQQHGVVVQNYFFKKLLEQTRKAQNIFNPSPNLSVLSSSSIHSSVSGSNNAAEGDKPWHCHYSLMNIGKKNERLCCNVERAVELKERLVAIRGSRQDTLSGPKEKLQLIDSQVSALEENISVQETTRCQLHRDCYLLRSLKEDERMRSRAEKEESKEQLMVLLSTVHRKQTKLICINMI